MGYTKEGVARLLKDGGGIDATSIAAIGQAEGGGTQSQHQAAVEFWTLALELEGDQELTAGQKVVAEAELARHQALVEAIAHPPAGPPRTQVF